METENETKAYTMTAVFPQTNDTVQFPIAASNKDEATEKAKWIARANFGNPDLWTITVNEK